MPVALTPTTAAIAPAKTAIACMIAAFGHCAAASQSAKAALLPIKAVFICTIAAARGINAANAHWLVANRTMQAGNVKFKRPDRKPNRNKKVITFSH